MLRYEEARGRWVLTATVLGSGLAFLDATVVTIALPRIGADLDADLAGLQWVMTAYLLTLSALILLGGTLGDRFGRRRIFLAGVTVFGVASLLCGLAASLAVLVAGRALQGVGGALLTPGSLAILQTSFRPGDRARAIGAWSGLSGLAAAAGPVVGGWLVEAVGWRAVFLVNLPLVAAVVGVTVMAVPETRDHAAPPSLDWTGASLSALGLAALTYALTAWPESGPGAAEVLGGLLLGVAALLGFLLRQHLAVHPMLPLRIFRSRVFAATNLVTFLVYAALSGVSLFVVVTLQVVGGVSPLLAGASLLPATLLLLLLSPRVGALASRIGPRWPMTVGPALAGLGAWLWVGLGPDVGWQVYAVEVLVPASVFGLGLALTVAPLTATVLAAVPDRHAGLASGVNTAVARVAALMAVAVLPLLGGLGGQDYADSAALLPAYRLAMQACTALLVGGAVVAAVAVRPGRDESARRGRSRPVPLADPGA